MKRFWDDMESKGIIVGVMAALVATMLGAVLWLNAGSGGFGGSWPYESEGERMGIPVCIADEFVEGMESCALWDEQDYGISSGILFNGKEVPLVLNSGEGDIWGTIYLSVNMDEPERGTLTSKNGALLYWSGDSELTIIDGNAFCRLTVEISGLPIMSINTTDAVPPVEVDYYEDPDTYVYETYITYKGTMKLFNPYGEQGAYEVVETPL